MCFATAGLIAGIAGAGISGAGAIEGGQATANVANYQAAVASNNAIVENQNAVYALQAGNVAATTQGLKGAQVAGKIKAGQAASNIDVNTGSAKAVQAGQREVSELDTETVVNNADLTAYGYRTKATSDEAQAGLDELTATQAPIGADIGAAGSLLSSASALSGKWNQGGGGSGGFPNIPGFNPIAGASGSTAT
jgi:hypothetical protein